MCVCGSVGDLKDPFHSVADLVESLVFWRPLQDPLHNALQLINGGGLFGISEDRRLVTPNH